MRVRWRDSESETERQGKEREERRNGEMRVNERESERVWELSIPIIIVFFISGWLMGKALQAINI